MRINDPFAIVLPKVWLEWYATNGWMERELVPRLDVVAGYTVLYGR